MGYNNLNSCAEFFRTKNERNWKDVRIKVFDAPNAVDKPYRQRLELLQQSKQKIMN
jgi:hypothetical protein